MQEDHPDEQQEEKSKSQKKREAEALQYLGLKLSKLTIGQLDTIPLPEEIKAALLFEKTIQSNGARKRHFQYIGRIMRDVDDTEIIEIENAYQSLEQGFAADAAQFHLIEQWRKRLLSADENALTEFLQQYPCEDIQKLRQLIRKSIDEHKKQKDLGAYKALFRLIKSIIL